MATVIVNTKSPCGKCYFTDGTVEEIIAYTHYSEDHIVFQTKSGQYAYRSWAEPLEKEILYADNNARLLMVPKHSFFKTILYCGDIRWSDFECSRKQQWVPYGNIDKIEIEY